MKRWIAAVLAMIALGVCPVFAAPDADAVTLLVSHASLTGKTETDVSVSAAEAPDACSGSLTVVYDEGLDVVQCEKGSLLEDKLVLFHPESERNQVRVNFMGVDPIGEAGELLRIRLRPRSGSAGAYRISVREASLYRFDETAVPLRLIDGAVEVKAPAGGAGASDTSAPTEPPRQETWANPFSDVAASAWYYESVRFAVERGLMKGVSATQFLPDHELTRAELVTVLYRSEKEPDTDGETPFADVSPDAFYAGAVAWARKNGIVNGVTETRFMPNASINREQIAAILFRFARYQARDVSAAERTELSAYRDASDVSGYAAEAMRYMVANGWIKGTSDSTLSPLSHATRAEIATILRRFLTADA